MSKLILSIILAFSFSCASISKQARKIKVGDSKEQVENIMGEAEDIQSQGSKEAWQYCKTNFGQYVFSIVWFDSGVVTGTTNYNKPGRPASFCDANFDSVRWENAPDKVIEIRNR